MRRRRYMKGETNEEKVDSKYLPGKKCLLSVSVDFVNANSIKLHHFAVQPIHPVTIEIAVTAILF